LERIRADRRHTGALLLLREPIEHRSFPDWTMGATTATLSDLQEAVGTNDFSRTVNPCTTLATPSSERSSSCSVPGLTGSD
jgi:hypothetical protein